MKTEAVLPLAALMALSLAAGAALHAVTGGAELGDDAPRLLWMCLHPAVLFGDYRAAGLWDTWGSFPPLLPGLFGLPVRPAAQLASPFVAIRIGALAWTAACLLATASAARATMGAQGSTLRLLLMAFALLPPVWMAAAVLPQEEAYVALFALAIHRAAHARATRWLLPLFVVTALAGKYFLLILMLPVAFHVGRPMARLAVWVPVVLGLLGAWVAYHFVAHGLLPIVSHNVDPGASISLWALLWNLGVQPPVAVLKPASVLLCVAAVAALCLWVRGRVPLAALMASSLLITLLCLSITFPGYVIWAIPLTLLASLEMGRRDRLRLLGLLGLWGVGELLANASRGVELALTTSRGAGKEAVADAVTDWLGADVPFALLESLGIVAVLVAGVLLVRLLVRAPGPTSARRTVTPPGAGRAHRRPGPSP